MESILQVGELIAHVILTGMFALAPGIIVWLAVTTIALAIRKLKRVGISSLTKAEEEMLLAQR
ncbi:hypothetical protein ACFLTC_03730 [Chloroflexota bacterium]